MDSVEANYLYRKAKDRLLHLFFARRLIEGATGVKLPVDILQFQERLRNGVYLALLVRCFDNNVVIFDEDQSFYEKNGLHFKHIGNIQVFLNYLKCISLPAIFHPEIPDIYEKKNIFKLMCCLRALTYHIGFEFETDETDVDISPETIIQVTYDLMNDGEESSLNYNKFENILLTGDFNNFCQLIKDMLTEVLDLEGIVNVKEICLLYFDELREARLIKRKPLTINEIIAILKKQNRVYKVTIAIKSRDKHLLLETLTCDLHLAEVVKLEFIEEYESFLRLALEIKKENDVFNYLLTNADILDAVEEVNRSAETIKNG